LYKYRNTFYELPAALTDLVVEGKHKLAVLDTPFKSFVLATHPDTAREILKDNELFPKFLSTPNLFASMLDESLVMVNGEIWKNQRTTMSPAFHFDFLTKLMGIMQDKTDELIARVPKGEGFDAKNWLNRFTIDVLGLTAFGMDFKSLSDEGGDFFRAYQDLFFHGLTVFRKIIPPSIREKLPLPSILRARRAKERLIAMTHDIIESRKQDTEKRYLLDMMLGAQLTEKEFETNVFLFFVAGHETTAGALSWALFLLAKHQDVQTRVREEVDRVLQGKHATAESLKHLVYLDMFIKEVLRYGTPVSLIISRAAKVDTELDGHFIPKNTPVGVSMYTIHHDPQFWPNPDVFDPERFRSEAKQYPFSFLPFSLGKRVCIGNNFSLMEQKIFISTLLQQYIITWPNNKPQPLEFESVSLSHSPAKVNICLNKR
jgi:cytochrome P450